MNINFYFLYYNSLFYFSLKKDIFSAKKEKYSSKKEKLFFF
jgi:hypothetical protein